MAYAQGQLIAAFEGALLKRASFTIELGEHTWKVDLDLLAKKSEFFANIQKNKQFKEYQQQIVTLHDDEPEIFATALQFMNYDVYTTSRDERITYDMIAEGEFHYSQSGSSVNNILSGSLRNSASVVPPVLWADITDRSYCVAMALQLLAQKYNILELATHTGNVLAQWVPTSVPGIVDVFSTSIDSLHVAERRIKKILGGKIAKRYNEVRQRKTEAAKTVHEWLEADADLALEVCDNLQTEGATTHDDTTPPTPLATPGGTPLSGSTPSAVGYGSYGSPMRSALFSGSGRGNARRRGRGRRDLSPN